MSRTYRRKGQRMDWTYSPWMRERFPQVYVRALCIYHRDWRNNWSNWEKLWTNRKLRRQLSLETQREEEEAHEDRYMEREWTEGLLASHKEA